MEIRTISVADEISERHLYQLYELQKICWWSEPFREFKKCPCCSRLYSIEDVLWKNDNSDLDIDFECVPCSEMTEDIYGEEFLQEIRDYIKGDVNLILSLSAEDKLSWFWVITRKTIEGIVNYEFATRPDSYDPKLLQSDLSEVSFSDSQMYYKSVILLHHIYITPGLRGTWASFQILKTMFESFSHFLDTHPVILETRFDSWLYPITRYLWFQDRVFDKYWYVTQVLPQAQDIHEDISSLSHDTSSRKQCLEKYAKHAKHIISSNKIFTNTRFYM